MPPSVTMIVAVALLSVVFGSAVTESFPPPEFSSVWGPAATAITIVLGVPPFLWRE